MLSLRMHVTLGISAVAIASLLNEPQACASSFEAICGRSKCTIELKKEKITTPHAVIPTSRVANWGGGGKSKNDLILGTSTTYLLGPVGLVGFAAKVHDYNYSITGYNQEGEKIFTRIRFRNEKPALKFAEEMLEFTRLRMDQKRTASDIRRIEKMMKENSLTWVGELIEETPSTGQ